MFHTEVSTDKATKQLSFPNVKEVFGRDDYNIRSAIAQTLLRKGDDKFGSSKTDFEGMPARNQTNYTGSESQNAILAKIPTSKLREIKADVLKCDKDFPKCLTAVDAKLPPRPASK